MTRKLVVMCTLGGLGLVLLGGCFFPSPGTGEYQGGSNLIQATTKFTSDRLDTMNPDDVQVLASLAPELTGQEIPEVTDEQAAAVVQFIEDNSIVTFADLEQIVAQAAEDPDSIVISPEVQAVIDSFIENPPEGFEDQV
jgi:exosome complex RNA-binding protein Csl4